MTKKLYLFARWVAAHKFLTVSIWLLFAVGVVGWAISLNSHLNDNYSVPGTQAQQAADDLGTYFPQVAGPSATVVFESTKGSITGESDQEYVGLVLKQIHELDGVVAITNPFREINGLTPNISQDKTTALVNVNYSTETQVTESVTDSMTSTINDSSATAKKLNIKVIPGGNTYFMTASVGTDDTSAETLGLIAAVIILLIAFGSVVAMGLPLFSALAGLVVGISLTYVLAGWLEVSSVAPTIATMIGLGVGIDYSLFIVNRYREIIRLGHSVPEATGRAIGTAGQAVIVAGLTVIIALMGLQLIDIPIMTSIAYATAVTVGAAIITSVTLLPALLAMFGKNVEKLNVHHLVGNDGTSTKVAAGWGKTITSRPRLWAVIALVIFSIFIIPVFSIELGPPGEDSVPEDNSQRIAYDIISEKFGPGYNGPLLVVSTLPDGQTPESNLANLGTIEQSVAKESGVLAVIPATINQHNTAAIWSIIPTTSPSDPATEELINNVRDNTIPNASDSSGITTYIGGQTATFVDMAELISSKMLLFMVAVIGMAYILLLVVFRSVFIPTLAAGMILLTAGATFGVMVAIFQWGWFGHIIGIDGATGPLVSYVPIMVFAIIFGLSMDYMIFLVSRIRENYLESNNSKKAIIFGISKSARVIVAAALIMFCVFASFNTQSNVVIKMFGTGLAVAIILDVILARMILVPSIMTLGNKLTWKLPKWLSWLPDLRFEDSSVFDDKSKPIKKPSTKRKRTKSKE